MDTNHNMNADEFKKAFSGGGLPPETKKKKPVELEAPEIKVTPSDIIENKITNPIDNPLVKKIQRLPGETFRLPTRGIFYTNGEISESIVNGEVVVYPLTGHEELIMKSPDMMFQGTAIEQVIARCVPGILKPLDLSANDIEYLLACIKKVTNGEFIKIFYQCDSKENPTPVEERILREYDISILPFIHNVKEITKHDRDNLSFNLGDIFDVTVRPTTMRKILEVRQSMIPKYDDILEASYAAQLKILTSVIKKVDQIEDEDMIMGWLEALPVNLRDELLNKIQVLSNWGITFDCKFICKDCEKEVHRPTSINPIDFFLRPYGLMIQ